MPRGVCAVPPPNPLLRAAWRLLGGLLLLFGAALAWGARPELPLTPAEAAWVAQHPVVRVGVAVEFPPYYFAAERGRYEGFVIDLMDRLAQRTGVRLEYQRFASSGDVLDAMRAGSVDLTPFSAETPERADDLRFVGPLFATQTVVVADRRLGDVSADSGFAAYRVAVERHSSAADLMRTRYPQARLVEYEHAEKAVLGTAAGEADVFVGYRQVAAYYMEKHLTANLVMRGSLATPDTALGPAVRKSLPQLAGVFEKAIQELSTEEIAEVAARWMPRSAFGPPPGARATLTPGQRDWVSRHGTVRLGFDENFSPIAFKNRAGGFDGLAADLTHALAAKVGLVIAYEQGASFADVYESARRGDLDVIVAAGRNSERSLAFDFVGPILRVPTVVVAAAGQERELGLDSPGPWRLALLREHFLMPRLRSRYPNLRLVTFDTQAEVLQAVRDGQADLALGNMKVVSQLLESHHLGALRAVGVVEQGDSELYFAVRNTKPELALVLRAGLDALSPAERTEIENRWLRVDWSEGVPWTRVALLACAILAASALVITSLWLGNRRLRQAKATLRDAHALAQTQVAARAHFTAYLAHELRGSLGGLAGGLDLLARPTLPASRREPLLAAMRSSARGLLELCERTLDLERMLAGGLDIQPAPARLPDTLEQALAPWRVQAELKGVALTLRSGLAADAVARVDAVRLTQVLQNLVGNAVKFTPRGEVRVDVVLADAPAGAGHTLQVTVADQGPGVPVDEQAQLFQAFAQGTAGRRQRAGAGLGLSISARIVEAMGGQIALLRSSAEGSVFSFQVPLVLLPPDAPASPTGSAAARPSPVATHDGPGA